jgi:hydroxyacylglutathione hydrolase
MPQHGDLIIESFTGGGFAQNGFVVRCTGTDEAVLVDPGASIGEMLAAVRAAGAAVTAIVLTHAHLDHVDGVARAKLETGAPVLLHRDAEEMYRAVPVQAQWFGMRVDAPPPVDAYLEIGGTVEIGGCSLEIRHAPGHAPGHVILVGDGAAIVGDCVFAGSIGRTDLPGGDFQTLMHSIRSQILTLPDETVLYSGHGPETTVGHERATNPFLAPQLGGSSFA